MGEEDRRFHETWLGMVQPTEGLVVSLPVLVDAQCAERKPPHVQRLFLEQCVAHGDGEQHAPRIADLRALLTTLLGYSREDLAIGEELPEALSLYVPEGRQVLRPTMALRARDDGSAPSGSSPAPDADPRYAMLVWDVGENPGGVGLDLDRAETVTGPWDYPAAAKFERLLRHCRVPIGLLVNRDVLRLVYAPHGQSTGSITFRVDDMVSVSGRPIFDAFVMLLSAHRFFGVTEERSLPALLAESRKRQANVTSDLTEQVLDALHVLLHGFEAAFERDGDHRLRDALEGDGDHFYGGLRTVVLRVVVALFAEDRGILPVDHPLYAQSLSVTALFEELQADAAAYPDVMSRRFGAWGRLIALFRAIYLGLSHGDLRMPARRGSLFDPGAYPFLEGWGPGGTAPITQADERAKVRLPSVDDETVHRLLRCLLLFEGQRLSYRALEEEHVGTMYEALLDFRVVRLTSAAVCTRPNGVWVEVDELRSVPPNQRTRWLKDTVGASAAQAQKVSEAIARAVTDEGVLDALSSLAPKTTRGRSTCARAGQLVLQPTSARRRTGSHYTPRSLTEPIVRRTLEPLLAAMGDAPSSERLLNLKICDPAMGSGAFLVAACRCLAEHVLAAWLREGKLEELGRESVDPLLHARRVVAQRCLYGVDRNVVAVEIAKVSLWLLTLSRTLPFTFLDHSLCHGDSLVGLDFDQIRSFHWRPKKQLELSRWELDKELDEALPRRAKIGDLAFSDSITDQREKERLLEDARDAMLRVRLIADLVVGAFFSSASDKEREKERRRRLDLVVAWLANDRPPDEELLAMQRELRARVPAFHWMVEFAEVFHATRPDPLDDDRVNREAHMDAFVGNPPFAGKNAISEGNGEGYIAWIGTIHEGAHGNADLSAHFFRRAAHLLGAHGTVGLVATNTIAQGDTRATGLQYLVEHGATIYDATSSMPWPGDAAVMVSVAHLAFGRVAPAALPKRLDGAVVGAISSQLTAGAERGDPKKLAANASCSFNGNFVLGMGFTLTPEERAALVVKDARNAERTFPYLGGQEVNTSPTQTFDRYVINFGAMSLEDAARWPDLLAIVREKVKPERDRLKDNADGRRLRQYWWQFARERPALGEAIAPLKRCLVTARVSKHLILSFQPTNRVFSEQLYVFPPETSAAFAVLQSRVHEPWARLLSSSMRNDLRYSASDCFDTFPFPEPDPRAVLPDLEEVGQYLYEMRAKYMVDENIGLTITYNRLKDPTCTEARVLALRALHEDMDRAVLAAYAADDPEGDWSALVDRAPPFCPLTDADTAVLKAFEDAVIDRLFALNARRSAEEARKGLGAPASKRAAKARAIASPDASTAPARSSKRPGLTKGMRSDKTAAPSKKRSVKA